MLFSFSNSQDEVVERVKARLQEEGREARNLVAYSLPLLDPPQTEGGELQGFPFYNHSFYDISLLKLIIIL